MSESELLKISEIAELGKVLSSTIRHYTDIGLLRVTGYTDGGHRLYSRSETLERLQKISALSKRGLSLPDIKKEFDVKVHSKKVLVIDDEPEVGDLVSELVNSNFPGWETKVVHDGFSAGKILSEFLPDLVILDLMLPGIDGFQVCKQIRIQPELSGIYIIAITGYDSPEMKAKIMDAGANDYLAKPMDIDMLIQKIKVMA